MLSEPQSFPRSTWTMISSDGSTAARQFPYCMEQPIEEPKCLTAWHAYDSNTGSKLQQHLLANSLDADTCVAAAPVAGC